MDTLFSRAAFPFYKASAPRFSAPIRFLLLMVCATLFAVLFDGIFLRFFQWMQTPALHGLMFFLSDFAGPIVILAMGILLFRERKLADGVLFAAILGVSAQASFLLKYFFHVPRPGAIFDIAVLKLGSGFAFPSAHTVILFALLAFSLALLPRVRMLLMWLAPAVAISRLYLGSHLLSDIVFGGFVGFGVAWGLILLEQRYCVMQHFLWHIQDKFELRRQIAHAVCGVAIIFLVKLKLLSLGLLFLILIVGGIFSLLARMVRVPFLHDILQFFERPHHMERFPGRGSFFLVFGSFLSLLLFPELIALAAIAIVAFGDSVNNIVGRYFGRVKLPWNQKKHAEGLLISILVSTMAASYFVPLYPALFGSTVAMFLETIPMRIKWLEIDDNLLVPLAAGIAMVVSM